MHNTTPRKKRDSEGFTITTQRREVGNLFPIQAQIALAKRANPCDKRRSRMKSKWRKED